VSKGEHPHPSPKKKEGIMPLESELEHSRRQVTYEMEAYFAEVCIDFNITSGILEITWDEEEDT
jgi:hypothetical protein